MKMNTSSRLLSVAMYALSFLILGSVTEGRADDQRALSLVQVAQTQYAERGTPGRAMEAYHTLESALSEATSDELKFDILWQQSRALYYTGSQSRDSAERLRIFDLGIQKAQAANAVPGMDRFAEGHYYYAISLARWAETRGVVASLSRKRELMNECQAAIDRVTRAGQPGKTLDGWGPYRVLGRVYFRLPGFAGGSRSTSIQYLSETFNNARHYVINGQYYAESLSQGSAAEKAHACQILNELSNVNPQTLDPSRIPETTDDVVEVRRLKDALCR